MTTSLRPAADEKDRQFVDPIRPLVRESRSSAAPQGWAGAAGGSESGASTATFHDPSACLCQTAT